MKNVRDTVPEIYDPSAFRRILEDMQRITPQVRDKGEFFEIPLYSDGRSLPLFRAPYPLVLRRGEFWSPVEVPPNSVRFSLINVLITNPGRLSVMPNQQPMSTSDGFQQFALREAFSNDERGTRAGPQLVMDAGQVLVIQWEHKNLLAQGGGASPQPPPPPPPQQGEGPPEDPDPPNEMGIEADRLFFQVDTERA